jgi:hypothetical protein
MTLDIDIDELFDKQCSNCKYKAAGLFEDTIWWNCEKLGAPVLRCDLKEGK